MKKFKLWGIVLLLISIVLGFGVNYVFYEPTEINAFIAAKVYKAPANNYFNDDNLYKLVVDSYNDEHGTDLPYTTNLTDEQLNSITFLSISCDYVYDVDIPYCREDSVVNDLTGLEKLTSLGYLSIYDMPYETLDVSSLTVLTGLTVMYTNISEIDLSNNPYLKYLSLVENKIESLDVSANVNLIDLDVSSNNLTNIDVSYNTNLETLNINDNNLISSLDVTKNTKIQELSAANTKISSINLTNNSELKFLKLGKEIMWGIGCGGEDCELPVYQSYVTSLDLSNNKLLEELYIDNAPIESLDVSKNTKLQVLSATSADLTSLDLTRNTELTSLIASKSKLTSLNLGNAPIEELELSSTKLSSLILNEYQNQLSMLDVSGIPIQDLDISALTNLSYLDVSGTKLSSLDLSKNVDLTSLSIGKALTDGSGVVSDFALTNIDLEKNVNLENLYISKSDIEDLDISKNVNLEDLYILDTPIKELNLDNNTKISDLNISLTEIENLDLTSIEGIQLLEIYDTPLESLIFGNVSELYGFVLENTNIKKIDLSSIPSLDWFYISENDFGEEIYVYKGEDVLVNNTVKLPEYYETTDIEWTSDDESIATVDENGLVKIKTSGVVNISGVVQEYDDYYQEYYDVYTTTSVVNIVEINSDKYTIDEENSLINITDSDVDVIKNNINVSHKEVILDIDLENNKLYVKYGELVLKEFDIEYNDASVEENIFEDKNFYKCVINGYNEANSSNVTSDTILTDEQLSTITRLDCSGKNDSDDKKIVSTKGIEKLTSLNYMYVVYHLIEDIDLSNNLNLSTIIVFDNKISELDVSKNLELTYLNVSNNLIKQLDVTNNTLLEHLEVSRTLIEELDLSANRELTFLSVGESRLLELDISHNAKLTSVSATSGILKKINTNGAISLSSLAISCNQLTELDMSSNINLSSNFIHTNPFSKTVYGYKNTQAELVLPVKYPSKYSTTIFDKAVWNSDDASIAIVGENQNLVFGNSGITTLRGVAQQYQWGEMHDVTIDLYINVVEITSDKYIIDDDSSLIYVDHDSTVSDIKDNVLVSHDDVVIDVDLDNKKLFVKHVSDILKEFDLIFINLDENITTDEDVTLDESIKVDETKKYFYNIDFSTSVTGILDKIDTDKEVIITNNNNKILTGDDVVGTGTKVTIKSDSAIYKYTIVVRGDTTGDGKSNVTDVSKLYQSLRKKIQIEDYFKEAGNVAGNDSEIKIADVSKLYQFVKKKISSLEG